MYNLNKENLDKLDENILKLKSTDSDARIVFLKIILENQIKNKLFSKSVKESFLYLSKDTTNENSNLIVPLMTGGYLDFYNLTDIFIDNLETSLEHFYFYSLEKVYQWLNIKGFLNDEIIDILEDKYKYAVETYIKEYLSDNIQGIISSTIENTKISLDESSTIDDCIDYYLDFVDQDIYQYIDETLDQIHDKAIYKFSKNKIDESKVYFMYSVNEETKNLLMFQDKSLEDDENKKDSKNDDWKYINEMFKYPT